ncbi:hypothetical protein [Sinomicrobium oceani]|uniref:hypothetical protein n=1 Tax=Sinomicrobium oceani TaxID=1150368 RepID=UPI00227D6000|nr:hypothetical protein [Sinomicrobium oceani]
MEQKNNTEREKDILPLQQTELTDTQKQIYDGLSTIRPEIAELYLDGFSILKSNLKSKSYLLAHILREVESGLRDIFGNKKSQKELQKKIDIQDLQRLFDEIKNDYQDYEYLKNISFEKFKDAKGHISSILVAFGYPIDHPLSKQYIKVAIWLAKYAHRSNDYNQPRDPKDIIRIWNEFESILLKLLGNYFAIADRLDVIIKLQEPTEEVMRTLPNIFRFESRHVYFFNHLKSPRWLSFLEEKGYFNGGDNPEPLEVEDPPGAFVTPFWPVLTYLQKVAQYNKQNFDKKSTGIILNIIDDIMQYRNDEGNRVENYHTDYIVFRLICDIPEDYLENKHFEYIRTMLYSNSLNGIRFYFNEFLQQLITYRDKNLLFKGLKLLFEFYIQGEYSYKVESIFGEHEFERILQECKENLITVLNVDLLQFALDKVNQVLQQTEYAFSTSDIPAIENHTQTWNPNEYECQLIYLIRDCLERIELDEIRDELIKFSKEGHPIYKRLAVHTIRMRYEEFQDLFWDFDGNPLDLSSCKHELYELLKWRVPEFTEEEIHKVLNWIETCNYDIHESLKNDPDMINKYIAGCKKEWLTALLPIENKVVAKKWEELHAINSITFDHPGIDSWTETKFGNESPIGDEELACMSIEEIISYCSDFQSKERDFFGPDLQGLIDVLKQVIIDNPDKFNIQNNPVVTAPASVQYSWIYGISQLWEKEITGYQWGQVLHTIKEIVTKDDFWRQENEDNSYGPMFVSNVLSFLIDGLKNDNHALDHVQLPAIKEILFTILEKDTFKVHDYKDLSMTVLNSTKGKCYMALMQYSLRLARVENKEGNRWDSDIKLWISKQVHGGQENSLLFFVLGQFLPNIQYLDEPWLLENFNVVFQFGNKSNWSAAIQGYFVYNRLNTNLCKLFLKYDHLNNALNENILLDNKLNYILNHICSAFLLGIDEFELGSEIIQRLVGSEQVYVYHSIQRFLARSVIHEVEEKNKVQALWKALYDKAILFANENVDKEILSGCCLWLKNVNRIDNVLFEILLNSVEYISNRDQLSVMKALNDHIDNTPKEVGEILVGMCNHTIAYSLSRTLLQQMVDTLYKKGLKEVADNICLLNAENGMDFLRPVYSKYNT